jgi:hypothetical protein
MELSIFVFISVLANMKLSTSEQTKELEDVFKLAEQRRAAAGKGDNYLF